MLQCPYCSAALSLSSGHINVSECSCGKILRIQEGIIVKDSRLSSPAEKSSYIQKGTTGVYEQRKFRVTGRFFTYTADAVFNYWTILFDDGEACYLAEGYGIFTILKKTVAEKEFNTIKITSVNAGHTITLPTKEWFQLIRKSENISVAAEGEVMLPECSSTIQALDYYSNKGRYLSVFFFSGSLAYYYDTFFVTPEFLQLTVPIQEPVIKNQNCLKCYKPLTIKAAPYTISLACHHCGTTHLVDPSSGALKAPVENNIKTFPDIALGSSGTIKGINYEVIGYSLKEEINTGAARWKEYTLYSRQYGFAYLSEFEGHWIYVKESPLPPLLGDVNISSFIFDSTEYALFNKYTYDVIHTIGEHPYNVLTAGKYQVREFVFPPKVWFVEKSTTEIDWFCGEHMPEKQVYESFHFPGSTPPKSGIGMVEPTGMVDKGKLAKITLFSCLFLFLIHILTSFTKEDRPIFKETYFFNDSVNTIKAVTPKFSLNKWKSSLAIEISAPVSNSWFELQATLINTDNGKEYSVSKGVEYYYGYTDGENWKEGGTSEEAYFTGIPAGNYLISFTGIREPGLYKRLENFDVNVVYDVSFFRNVIFCILLVLGMAVIQYMIFVHYDKKRWYNSSYSKYNYED